MSFQKNNQEFITSMLMKVWFADDEALPLLVDQTLSVFEDWIQTEILSAISDDQMEKFDTLLSQDISDEQLYNFFNQSIKNFDSFMDWLYDQFEKMYISNYKQSLNKS